MGCTPGCCSWLLAARRVPVLLLTPSLARRRAWCALWPAACCSSLGMRLRIRGLERLQIPCVVVANHASYLDGVVLAGGAAAELQLRHQARNVRRCRWPGLLLRRIGAEFVERHDRGAAARAMHAGCCARPSTARRWCSFPEGTFSDRGRAAALPHRRLCRRRARRPAAWCRSPSGAPATACRQARLLPHPG